MTYQEDCTLPTDLLEKLTEQGLEPLPEMIRLLVNEAMRIERQSYLGAGAPLCSPEGRPRGRGQEFLPNRLYGRRRRRVSFGIT
jgi:hypothetical protein